MDGRMDGWTNGPGHFLGNVQRAFSRIAVMQGNVRFTWGIASTQESHRELMTKITLKIHHRWTAGRRWLDWSECPFDAHGVLGGAHGGGTFSGKFPTKVDRSAAYFRRQMAESIVKYSLRKSPPEPAGL
jgi:hypothetical protein